MEYIIQENVFREHHYGLLNETMKRLDLPYKTVRVFPFVDKIVKLDDITTETYNVDDLPDYQPDSDNIFVFGAMKLARVAALRKWKPGSMMNDNHDYTVYSKYYKENLLNYDSVVQKVSDTITWKPNEVKFIRPTKDSKAFTGKVFTEIEWEDTCIYNLRNFKSSLVFTEWTEIQVASPKMIHKEIRFWVVDGKIVTGSQYRLGDRVVYDDIYEEEAQEFAQRMVDTFQLADAFVIDVCDTDNGWKVVECGCINCCGFYKSDIQKMVIALENKFDSK